MHRDKFTEKLVRIIKSIEAGSPPVPVTELYVFGSYSRGALVPGDLDLIVIHEPATREYMDTIRNYFRQRGIEVWDSRADYLGRFHGEIRRALFKPGERIQAIVAESVTEVTGEGSRIRPSDPVLIWSRADPNWEDKLASIKPDNAATRAERNHLMPLPRLNTTVGTMEAVVEMITLGRLLFDRISVGSIECNLNEWHTRWLAHWTKCKVMGTKSMEALPFAMWWFQQHGQQCQVPDRTELWSEDRSHRAEVGKVSLRWMLNMFETRQDLVRQCLIPHLLKKGPNDLLVFERGPSWSDNKEGDPIWAGA